MNQTHSAREVNGRLNLTFGVPVAGGPTRLRALEQYPPLRVVRPFSLPGGGVLIHLHNISGAVLGGDRLATELCLQEGARVQVTTTGATRIYRHRPSEGCAEQVTRCTIGQGALLEVLPDPLIPYAGSQYRQKTSYELAEGAGLLAWELITPGREAHGERFAYDTLELHTTIHGCGAPLAQERICLQPRVRPLDSPMRLGRYGCMAAFYACKTGAAPEVWAQLERELGELAEHKSCAGEIVWGASALPADGVVVRGLSRTQRQLAAGLPLFWSAARQFLYGEAAIMPRKLY